MSQHSCFLPLSTKLFKLIGFSRFSKFRLTETSWSIFKIWERTNKGRAETFSGLTPDVVVTGIVENNTLRFAKFIRFSIFFRSAWVLPDSRTFYWFAGWNVWIVWLRNSSARQTFTKNGRKARRNFCPGTIIVMPPCRKSEYDRRFVPRFFLRTFLPF